MSILVIGTGGTIGALPYDDVLHPPDISTFPPEDNDPLHVFLDAYGAAQMRYINAGSRDSKHIDQDYLLKLLRLIEIVPENEILVTNGVDTILQTSEFLFRRFPHSAVLPSKTVILTGAMVPLSNGPDSDGYLNLTFSLDLLLRGKVQQGIHFVLCDYHDSRTRSGWSPRLYNYKSGIYEKVTYPPDKRYTRIRRIEPLAKEK